MRAERIVDELAREIALAVKKKWDELTEAEREEFRKQARAKVDEVRARLNDRKRKVAE